jgi:Uncharacterised protein family (UPF0261)/Branched-chain amino acid transport system / permease component
MELPLITAVNSSGEAVYLSYPIVRLVIFLASVVIGLGIWVVLNRTRVGMIVRAGVDDREMLSAMGVPIQLVFVAVFAFGAGLAGVAGVIGGTFQSLSPGEDIRFLLAPLIVVIVGGMESIPGAALGAVIVGLAEQIGLAYFPQVTLMRTTAVENDRIGSWIGERLNQMDGPVRLLLPELGVSALDAPGQAFHDPQADAALFAALERTVRQTASRRLIRVRRHINDPGFSAGVVAEFRALHGQSRRRAAR